MPETTRNDTVHARRIHRLLLIIREIRDNPRQELSGLLERLGVSRTQFYKDRKVLANMGFSFTYSTEHGFSITADALAPTLDLTLSDRLLLMFALGHLWSSGEGHLVARALRVGRKLAAGLDEPFRSQVLDEFDRVVMHEGYGCRPEVLDALEQSVLERRRVRILYESRHSGEYSWREIDPLRIYFLQRSLYLYARCPDKNPSFRTFRLNRVREVRFTPVRSPQIPYEKCFHRQQANAFIHIMGDETEQVVIRFRPQASEYVAEGLWHHSQKLRFEPDGCLLFTVQVAAPGEVLRWATGFGLDAVEVLEPEWLRREATAQARTLMTQYEAPPRI
ncbi:helix-turn-helix transcriptional regulator [Desulfonatronum parangueonense]